MGGLIGGGAPSAPVYTPPPAAAPVIQAPTVANKQEILSTTEDGLKRKNKPKNLLAGTASDQATLGGSTLLGS